MEIGVSIVFEKKIYHTFLGIINRLDYIKDLGVDAIWLNPIYESPWVDSGYDITDHNKIHPTFGDAEDMDLLIEEAHERGHIFFSNIQIKRIKYKQFSKMLFYKNIS